MFFFSQELPSRKGLQRKNQLKAFFEEDQFYWAKSWPLMVLGDNVLPNKSGFHSNVEISLLPQTSWDSLSVYRSIYRWKMEKNISSGFNHQQGGQIYSDNFHAVSGWTIFWEDFCWKEDTSKDSFSVFFPAKQWASEFNDKTIYSTL